MLTVVLCFPLLSVFLAFVFFSSFNSVLFGFLSSGASCSLFHGVLGLFFSEKADEDCDDDQTKLLDDPPRSVSFLKLLFTKKFLFSFPFTCSFLPLAVNL